MFGKSKKRSWGKKRPSKKARAAKGAVGMGIVGAIGTAISRGKNRSK
jgi:hypothetical protein